MPLPWTKDQASALLSRGAISQDQYNAAYPEPIGLDSVELPPIGPEPMPIETADVPQNLSGVDLSPSPEPQSILPAEDEPNAIAAGFSALTDSVKKGYGDLVSGLQKIPTPVHNDPMAMFGGGAGLAQNPDQAADVNPGQAGIQVDPNSGLVKTPQQLEADAAAQAKAYNDAAAKEAQAMMAPYDTLVASAKLSEMTGMARAAEESAYLRKMQKDQDERLQAQLEWDQSQRDELEMKLTDLDRKADDLANQKIVEKDFWADKSTSQKIMGGVALFLGAVGAAKTGTNSAVKVIEDAINRDMDIQRINIDQQNKAYNAKAGIYASSFAMFKDHAAAKEAARLQSYEIAKIGISEMAARYKGPEVKAQAMNLIGQIELKKAETRYKLGEIMRQRQLMANLTSGKGMNPELMPKEMRERFVPGYGLTYNGETAKKLNMEVVPKYKTAERVIKNLVRISKLSALGKLSPKTLAEAGIDSKILQGEIRELIVGPGTLSESDKEDLVKVVGDPTKIFEYASSTARLEGLSKRTRQKFEDVMGQNINGYVPRATKFGEEELDLSGGK